MKLAIKCEHVKDSGVKATASNENGDVVIDEGVFYPTERAAVEDTLLSAYGLIYASAESQGQGTIEICH